MRRLPALLLIVLIFTVLTAQSAEAQEETQPTVRARREVEILNAGLLTVNDTFTLEAPSNESVRITSLKMGFPSYFSSERRYFYMLSEGRWQPLRYAETTLGEPRFYGYELQLPSPVVLDGERILEIKASYLFVDLVGGVGRDYYAKIPVYPATNYNVSTFIIQVTLPQGAVLQGVDSPMAFTNSSEGGLWTLRYEAEMLTHLMEQNATITYKPPLEEEYLLRCELMQRGISVKPGRLELEDTYLITNRGSSFSRFKLKLHEGAYNIKAHDKVGPLKITHDVVDGNGGHIELRIDPRSSVANEERWGFTVEYSLPNDKHIDGDGGRFTLTNPQSNFDHYIRRFVLVATLPEGGSFIASDPEPAVLKKASVLSQEVTIEVMGVIPFELQGVTIEYSWSPFWSALRPSTWALLAVGAMAAVYILRRRRMALEEEPVEAARPVLEDFLRLYRDRVALLAEQVELERRLSRREIGREQFDRRTVEITRRQRELLQALRQVRERLETARPEMRSQLRSIKDTEADLERADADLRNLEVRLRARRISRRDYSRRRRDCLSRRSRAIRRIEQLIASLQAEA